MNNLPGFQEATVTLLRECFEGIPPGKSGTWFVQGKEGLFDAFDSVTAEQASKKPTPDCASIAAHTYHILYAMQWANTCHGGPKPIGTWESSWEKQAVDATEWKELVEEVHRQYDSYLAWYEKNQEWTKEDIVIGTLAPLPHMAFHLGAIRQLMKVV